MSTQDPHHVTRWQLDYTRRDVVVRPVCSCGWTGTGTRPFRSEAVALRAVAERQPPACPVAK